MRVPIATLAPLALAACASGSDAETGAPADEAPQAWDWEADDTVPLATADEVADRLQEAVDRALTFHAGPILTGYVAAMQAEAPPCPTWYDLGEFHYWYDDCTTGAGATFDGYTFVSPAMDSVDYQLDGMAVWGSSGITLADGRVLHVGGRLSQSRAVGQGTTVWNSLVSGTFRWDGDEADGTWLADGYLLDLDMVAMLLPDGSGGRAMSVDGGIEGFDGDLSAVRFEHVAYTDTGDGDDSCLPEPSGILAARDGEGRWYELWLDGTEGTGGDGEGEGDGDAGEGVGEDDAGELPGTGDACDGCGSLRWLDQDLGVVCLDFSPLVDWSDEGPW